MGRSFQITQVALCVITSALSKESRGRLGFRGEGYVMTEVEIGMMCFKGRGHNARNIVSY